MKERLWSGTWTGVLLTIAAYLLVQALQRRANGHPLLNPVAGAIVLIVATLKIFGVPYAVYFASAKLLHVLLGPATVALAVPLAREFARVRRLAWPLLVSILAGSLTASFSAVLLAKAFGADRPVLLSLAPKSVTVPIAMGISEKIGGEPSLTAVLVILTGICGAVSATWLFNQLHIDDPAVRGVATGAAAHGIGTATIYQESAEAGAFSGLSMGLSGLITAISLPVVIRILGLG